MQVGLILQVVTVLGSGSEERITIQNLSCDMRSVGFKHLGLTWVKIGSKDCLCKFLLVKGCCKVSPAASWMAISYFALNT